MPNVMMSVLDAAFATARAYPGGVHSLAPRMGLGAAVLANKTNPQAEKNHLSLEEAVRLQHLTGNLSILHAMAAELGHVAIPAGGFEGTSDRELLEVITALWVQVGTVGARVHDGLADGVLTRPEVLGVRSAALGLIGCLHELLGRLDAIAEDA